MSCFVSLITILLIKEQESVDFFKYDNNKYWTVSKTKTFTHIKKKRKVFIVQNKSSQSVLLYSIYGVMCVNTEVAVDHLFYRLANSRLSIISDI